MKPMAKRLVIKALTDQGCYKASERGIHEKWRCPPTCGKHVTSVTRHNEITVGVIRSIINDLSCLPKGWLQ
jgi:predicted RNA binding protein YcfA (HicA-like mRNA interferase family)